MAEITVRAIDSALAMEEIQKRLGDDALIISTSRKDGQIEIIATDEDTSETKNNAQPLILDNAYRKDSFSSVYNEKFSKLTDGLVDIDPKELETHLSNRIDRICSELADCKNLLNSLNLDETADLRVIDKLQLVGIKYSGLKIIGLHPDDNSLTKAIQKIAKRFVSGKCPHFESTQLFVITGKKNSGKSTFAKKFISLMEAKDDEVEYLNFDDQNLKRFFKTLRALSSNDGNGNSVQTQKLVLDTALEGTDLDLFLSKVLKEVNGTNVSIIRTVEVGNSYERLLKEFSHSTQTREYIAFTKLDICDISMPEISALLEMSKKCMFLSGIDKVEDGLYYAKLDQIETHIQNKLKEELD